MAEPLRRLFTRDEYYAMAEAGILKPADRVELIEGEIFRMTPIGKGHAGCVNHVNRLFTAPLADRAVVAVQNPVYLNNFSEPEPDIAVLRFRSDFYRGDHPTPDDVLLLIEVADSSLEHDRRRKIPLYARSGIPETWLVNLNDNVLEVYRAPSRDGYREVRRLRRGDRIAPLAFPDLVIPVDAILPL
ncbi:MAG TPA: Uma2 family endonuclease [Thermoanaerobaculia bacterium]